MTFELISSKLIYEALESLNYDIGPYSGRGMFGKECLSVRIEHGAHISLLFLDLVEKLLTFLPDTDIHVLLSDIKKLVNSYRFDSLGKWDIVLYFPSIPYDEDTTNE